MSINSAGDVFAPRLPKSVLVAQARAATHDSLFSLPSQALRLVQTIISYTPISSPTNPILFTRDKPAQILKVSVRTIDRLLAQLEQVGWVRRLPQPRLGPGKWGCTSLQWCDWVVDFLFPKQTSAYKNMPNRATNSAHQSGFSPKGEVLQSKAHQAADFLENNLIKDDPLRRIPADLRNYAKTFGLDRQQVVILLGTCKKIGSRLQDVFEVIGKTLEDLCLQGRSALGWLLAVIKSKKDFNWLRKQATKETVVASQPLRRKSMAQKIEKAINEKPRPLPNGKAAINIDNGMVTIVKATGEYLGTTPIQMLISQLGKDAPWSVRELIRGNVDVAKPLSTHETINYSLPSEPINRELATAHLSELKNLLKQR